MEMPNIDFKSLLTKYLPFSSKFIGKTKRLKNFNIKCQQRFQNIQKHLKANDNILFQSLVEWLLSAEISERQSLAFLKFIDLQAEELINSLNPKLHDKIKDILLKIITDFDQTLQQGTFSGH